MKSQDIWKTLSSIDVSKKIEKKGNLSYLSWAWAWGVLMDEYPEAQYTFEPPVFYENGSCEVWVSVTIGEHTRQMWLPVMDYKNKSIQFPSSRDISDTRMRCLVKCLAMFGLGHYIYAGEDIPSVSLPDAKDTISGQKIDEEKVTKAYKFFVEMIEKDEDENVIAPKIKTAYARLKPDEQIAVNNMLKVVKFEKRQMNTILKSFLEFAPPEAA